MWRCELTSDSFLTWSSQNIFASTDAVRCLSVMGYRILTSSSVCTSARAALGSLVISYESWRCCDDAEAVRRSMQHPRRWKRGRIRGRQAKGQQSGAPPQLSQPSPESKGRAGTREREEPTSNDAQVDLHRGP